MELDLIKAVKKRPAIYKKTCLEFKCKTSRDEAWVAISKDVGVSVEACRQRWKSLRDRFVREHSKLMNESEKGIAEPAKCAWEFFEKLTFLEDSIRTRGSYNPFQSNCCTRYSRIERFVINAVKGLPILYERNQGLFRNHLERQQAWTKVSQKVGKSADRCRKTWREARERYITTKLEGRCKHADVMDFMQNHTDNIIDSDDEQYKWPKEEQQDEHSYHADTSQLDSFTVESVDEYTYDNNKEPPNKSFAKVFIESEEVNELPTSSNTTALRQLRVMEASEKFETLVGTLNNFVESRIENATVKSRNHEYYKVLDRYLQKMSEDEQDKMKAEILKMVFNNLGH